MAEALRVYRDLALYRVGRAQRACLQGNDGLPGQPPGSFEYVHTPRHGSWLDLIESTFFKMAHSFLRHIRVTCLDELKQRILQGIDEMNAQPVRFQWENSDALMTSSSMF
jgi:hypothetical protein